MANLVTALDGEIDAVEMERAQAKTALRDAQTAWRVRDREFAARLRQLRKARALLMGEKPKPQQKAGPEAVAIVRQVIRSHGKATQAEITKNASLNSGTVSYALAALVEAGVVRDTGKRVGRSHEFEFVGANEEVA